MKKMCKYAKLFCKWTVTVHMHGYCSCANDFYSFFLSPSSSDSHLSLFSFFFSLRINPLSSLFLSSHKLPLRWLAHRSAGLCIMSIDQSWVEGVNQSWVEWVSSLDAPGLWRSFHGRTVGGVDLVGQSLPSLTLSDLYCRWFYFVSSGFWDFDKWFLDLWIWVSWWWWLDDSDWIFGFLLCGLMMVIG